MSLPQPKEVLRLTLLMESVVVLITERICSGKIVMLLREDWPSNKTCVAKSNSRQQPECLRGVTAPDRVRMNILCDVTALGGVW